MKKKKRRKGHRGILSGSEPLIFLACKPDGMSKGAWSKKFGFGKAFFNQLENRLGKEEYKKINIRDIDRPQLVEALLKKLRARREAINKVLGVNITADTTKTSLEPLFLGEPEDLGKSFENPFDGRVNYVPRTLSSLMGGAVLSFLKLEFKKFPQDKRIELINLLISEAGINLSDLWMKSVLALSDTDKEEKLTALMDLVL